MKKRDLLFSAVTAALVGAGSYLALNDNGNAPVATTTGQEWKSAAKQLAQTSAPVVAASAPVQKTNTESRSATVYDFIFDKIGPQMAAECLDGFAKGDRMKPDESSPFNNFVPEGNNRVGNVVCGYTLNEKGQLQALDVRRMSQTLLPMEGGGDLISDIGLNYTPNASGRLAGKVDLFETGKYYMSFDLNSGKTTFARMEGIADNSKPDLLPDTASAVRNFLRAHAPQSATPNP